MLKFNTAFCNLTKILFLSIITSSCSQNNVFEFEKPIKAAFDMDDSMIFFSYGYHPFGAGPAYKLSEIKKIQLEKTEPKSVIENTEPPIISDANNFEPIGNYSPRQNIGINTRYTADPSFNLEIGNIDFTVKIDFEKCIIYDVYNYFGDPTEGQIVGFEFDPINQKPISYRAYSFNRIRTGWESVGSENSQEKRCYFKNGITKSMNDKNCTDEEKKELYELGIKIQGIIQKLLFKYMTSCPKVGETTDFDSVGINYRLDSTFNALRQKKFSDLKGNEIWKYFDNELTLHIWTKISADGIDISTDVKITYVDSAKHSGQYPETWLNNLISQAIRKDNTFNRPLKFMCLPFPSEKSMTIMVKNGQVFRFVK